MPGWGLWLFVWANSVVVLAGVAWLLRGNALSSVQSVVDAITAQLTKVRDEIVGQLDAVTSQVVEAGVEDQVDLSGLQAIADALDAIVPDAATEAEVEVEYEGLGEVEEFDDEEVVEVDEVVAVDETVEVDEDEEVEK